MVRNETLVYSSFALKVLKYNKSCIPTNICWILKELNIWKYRGGKYKKQKPKNVVIDEDIEPTIMSNLYVISTVVTERKPAMINKDKRYRTIRTIDVRENNILPLPNILVANSRSLWCKMDDLETRVGNEKIDICIITETWLTLNNVDSVFINGFNSFHGIRQNNKKKGGGVTIFCKDEMKVLEHYSFCGEYYESVLVTLRPNLLPRGVNSITVIAIYFPPNNLLIHQDILLKQIISMIDNVRTKFKDTKIIIGGDFNNFKYNQLVATTGLKQTVQSPTRGAAILDLIFTDMKDQYHTPEIHAPLIDSDHNLLIMRAVKYENNTPLEIRKRIFSDYNKFKFEKDMVSSDWNDSEYNDLDINKNLDKLYNFINIKYEKAFPLIVVNAKSNNQPWMNNCINSLIKKRNKAFKKGKKNEMKILNRQIKVKIKKQKKKYSQNKLKMINNQPKKYYTFLNNILNKKKSNTINIPNQNKEEIPEILNSFFNSLWVTHQKLDNSKSPAYMPYKPPIEFSITEVYEALKKMRTNCAVGPNVIQNWIWKEFAFEVSPILTKIFNQSINNAIIPEKWKIAEIIPVPKVSIPKSLDQFRPISLTDPICKILEGLLNKRFLQIVQIKIDPRQYGNLHGKSTSQYLISLLDWIHTAIESQDKCAILCAIDFKKAYDLVDHNVLIGILYEMETPGYIIAWIGNFLTGRMHYTKVNGIKSKTNYTTCGVPQGSIMAGILFLLLINNVAKFTENRWKFVDDMTIANSSLDELTSDIANISCQCSKLGMVLNIEKTKILEISFSKNYLNTIRFPIQVPFPLIESICLLGITIQKDLKWSSQVKLIISKTSKRLFILYKMRNFGLDTRALVHLYIIYIRPLLEYGSSVWHGGLTIKEEKTIESIQKRALKIILKDEYINYNNALNSVGIESLKYRRINNIINLGYKILNDVSLRNMLPNYRHNVHDYYIRNNNLLSQIKCKTTRRRNSPVITMVRLMNERSLTLVNHK